MRPPEGRAGEIRAAINGVVDPCSAGIGVPIGIDEMGLVEDVTVDGAGTALIRLQVTSPSCMMAPYFLREVERRGLEVDGVHRVLVEISTDLSWTPERMEGGARERLAARTATTRPRARARASRAKHD